MSSTNQTQESKDKGIIQTIGYKEFSAICDEYNIVESATKELLEMAQDTNTPVRVKVDIYKWIVEMRIGKPKQMNDITLQGEDDKGIKGFVIDYVDDHIENQALEKKLIEKGMTQEEIDNYAREYVYQYRRSDRQDTDI